MIFRILTLGLCAIGVYFLGTLVIQGRRSRTWEVSRHALVAAARKVPCEVRGPVASGLANRAASSRVDVVDVSPLVATGDLGALVHLRPGEHVTAVGDCAVSGDRDAAARIAARPPQRGGYVDLTVSSAAGDRRVLVLRH